MIQFVYPHGKRKIVTFSYDDGSDNDPRLIALFNRYGVKATFHLPSGRLTGADHDELRSRYAGHEVACHTVSHGNLTRMPVSAVVTEVMEDRRALEGIFGYPVFGMSYPWGPYNGQILETLQNCGIVYSRTIKSTNQFLLPDDFLQWHPTCHHNDALPVCETFLGEMDNRWRQPLLYIWGHSHDLKTEGDWQNMEKILQMISGKEQVWYATNMEIYEYVTALHRLQISVDESMVHNPSGISVWIERQKNEFFEIPAGKTVML